MSIDGPGLLDGAVGLQLVMSGIVVRTAKAATAVQIQKHEFRTRRAGPTTSTVATGGPLSSPRSSELDAAAF
jgi:hypothetical protein